MEPKVDKTTCCWIQCKWSQKLRNQNKKYLFPKSILSNKHKKPFYLFRFLFVSLLSSLFLCLWLWSCIKLKHHKNNLSFTWLWSILFCLFLRCLSYSRQKTADKTSNSSNQRQFTGNDQPYLPLEIWFEKVPPNLSPEDICRVLYLHQ